MGPIRASSAIAGYAAPAILTPLAIPLLSLNLGEKDLAAASTSTLLAGRTT